MPSASLAMVTANRALQQQLQAAMDCATIWHSIAQASSSDALLGLRSTVESFFPARDVVPDWLRLEMATVPGMSSVAPLAPDPHPAPAPPYIRHGSMPRLIVDPPGCGLWGHLTPGLTPPRPSCSLRRPEATTPPCDGRCSPKLDTTTMRAGRHECKATTGVFTRAWDHLPP